MNFYFFQQKCKKGIWIVGLKFVITDSRTINSEKYFSKYKLSKRMNRTTRKCPFEFYLQQEEIYGNLIYTALHIPRRKKNKNEKKK